MCSAHVWNTIHCVDWTNLASRNPMRLRRDSRYRSVHIRWCLFSSNLFARKGPPTISDFISILSKMCKKMSNQLVFLQIQDFLANCRKRILSNLVELKPNPNCFAFSLEACSRIPWNNGIQMLWHYWNMDAFFCFLRIGKFFAVLDMKKNTNISELRSLPTCANIWITSVFFESVQLHSINKEK